MNSFFRDKFVLDLGTLSITSAIKNKPGRWVNFPEKCAYQTEISIVNEDVKFYFVRKQSETKIFEEPLIKITLATVNSSPFFLSENEEHQRLITNRPEVFC